MKSSDWIIVDDRLPEVNTMVLICTYNGKCGISSMYIPQDYYGNVLGNKEWRGSRVMSMANLWSMW